MARFGKSKVFGDAASSGHDELMITPLLDLFVSLIPFLIIGVVMMPIHTLDVALSKPSSRVATSAQNFALTVSVQSKSVEVKLGNKVVRNFAHDQGNKWIEDVRSDLVRIKKENTGEWRMILEPNGQVTLETIITFMDAARALRPADGTIVGKDKDGKPTQLRYLFPQVVLKGVYS